MTETFRPPPVQFADERGRVIRIERGPGDRDALVEMYDDYAPELRSQGLPPASRARIESWLETIAPGLHVRACSEGRVVGHAALLAREHDHELMIFVHQDFRLAGIGRRLLESLLGYGRQHGVDTVWLCVSPDNEQAVDLYRSIGFEHRPSEECDFEMTIAL